jgi:hypothetical protein
MELSYLPSFYMVCDSSFDVYNAVVRGNLMLKLVGSCSSALEDDADVQAISQPTATASQKKGEAPPAVKAGKG